MYASLLLFLVKLYFYSFINSISSSLSVHEPVRFLSFICKYNNFSNSYSSDLFSYLRLLFDTFLLLYYRYYYSFVNSISFSSQFIFFLFLRSITYYDGIFSKLLIHYTLLNNILNIFIASLVLFHSLHLSISHLVAFSKYYNLFY